ncbi:hypothetical protein H0H87_007535, partial [Tephrocybe sp. NHM501043]
WLDLSKATDADLESLENVCQPASFGLGDKDVYDETYRKAGKLDCDQFATKLDLNAEGIIDRLHLKLLEDSDETKCVRAELYKLNVYGKGSFFKSHKDTPRGDTMFGSLVVVFPTPHDGGALVLRHHDQEWTFDSARLTREATEPSIAYIAFYSDVDHEVTPVQSGYRVTLTYNLFSEAESTRQQLARSVNPNAPDDHLLRDALAAALADSSFMPDGGYLGFGLSFAYPINKARGKVVAPLKGSDAMIERVCRQLGLSASLNAVFDDKYDFGRKLMLSAMSLPKTPSVTDDEGTDDALRVRYKGRYIINFPELKQKENKPMGRDRDRDAAHSTDNAIQVAWVTPMAEFNAFKSEYIATMGNAPGIFYVYGNLCIAVQVGPFGSRKTLETVEPPATSRRYRSEEEDDERYEGEEDYDTMSE